MRIAEIHVYQMDLPLNGKVYRMSEGAYSTLDSTIVEVVSDTGISGWGRVPGRTDLSAGARLGRPGRAPPDVTGPDRQR